MKFVSKTTIVIITALLALGGITIYYVRNNYVYHPAPIDNLIQQSGFSKAEAELIIEAVVKAGTKREEILQINKMSNGKVGVVTGNPNSYGPKKGGSIGYSAGTLYYLIKKGEVWEVESKSMWVE